MSKVTLIKNPFGAMIPADSSAEEYIKSLKIGQPITGEFRKPRNYKFHKKVFALFNFAFEQWDAPELEYKGVKVEKNFEQFRKDLTVIAGYSDVLVNLKGEVRVVAKSLSFASMDDAEFESVFKSLLNVVWKRVLNSKGYETPEKVEELLHELMRYEHG